MGTKSREKLHGSSIRASASRAAEARKVADRLALAKPGINAWLAFQGPAQPSPTLGDALNAGCVYLEVKCLGCNTHQTVALNVVRRPKTTPIHELERCIRCKDCSEWDRYAKECMKRYAKDEDTAVLVTLRARGEGIRFIVQYLQNLP